jgi:hypothetical protein
MSATKKPDANAATPVPTGTPVPTPVMVCVYRFEIWDQEIGDNVTAPRMATLETIQRIRGNANLASKKEVIASDLADLG